MLRDLRLICNGQYNSFHTTKRTDCEMIDDSHETDEGLSTIIHHRMLLSSLDSWLVVMLKCIYQIIEAQQEQV